MTIHGVVYRCCPRQPRRESQRIASCGLAEFCPWPLSILLWIRGIKRRPRRLEPELRGIPGERIDGVRARSTAAKRASEVSFGVVVSIGSWPQECRERLETISETKEVINRRICEKEWSHINQSINKSTNQSIDRSTKSDQSINQSNDRSITITGSQSIEQSIDEHVDRPHDQIFSKAPIDP